VHYVRFARSQPSTPESAVSIGGGTAPLPRIHTAATLWYAAFVLSPGSVTPSFVSLGPAIEIESELERWRAALAGGKAPDRLQWSAGRALRQRLWDPLAPRLAGAELTLIVPDGPLALVPWSTLPAPGNVPLLETGPTLHILNGARELLREPSRARRHPALIVGGVDYNAKPAAAGSGGGASPALRGRTASCVELAPQHHERLPGSGEEARRVARAWERSAGTGQDVLTGAGASERRVRAEFTGRGLVHLATHGYYVPDSCARTPAGGLPRIEGVPQFPVPEPAGEAMLRSGLVLAGANLPGSDPADDGILTAADLALLDLDEAQLVVLSACESGKGRVVNAEGVIGLRWALMQAGARTSLTSCHRVSDEATARWMEVFYASWLQGKRTVPEAAREASRQLRRELRERTGEDRPGAWGAFLSAGDWR